MLKSISKVLSIMLVFALLFTIFSFQRTNAAGQPSMYTVDADGNQTAVLAAFFGGSFPDDFAPPALNSTDTFVYESDFGGDGSVTITVENNDDVDKSITKAITNGKAEFTLDEFNFTDAEKLSLQNPTQNQVTFQVDGAGGGLFYSKYIDFGSKVTSNNLVDISNVSSSNNFSDMTPSNWAYSYVGTLANAGIINGYPGGYFNPDGQITRSEMAKIICESFRMPEFYYDYGSSWTPLSDVTPDKWDYQYARTVMNSDLDLFGVFYQSGLALFKGNAPVSRTETVIALVTALKFGNMIPTEKYATEIYSDCDGNALYINDAISIASQLGIINGYPDGTFGGGRTITRAETAAMFNRILENPVIRNFEDASKQITDSEAKALITNDVTNNIDGLWDITEIGKSDSAWGHIVNINGTEAYYYVYLTTNDYNTAKNNRDEVYAELGMTDAEELTLDQFNELYPDGFAISWHYTLQRDAAGTVKIIDKYMN